MSTNKTHRDSFSFLISSNSLTPSRMTISERDDDLGKGRTNSRLVGLPPRHQTQSRCIQSRLEPIPEPWHAIHVDLKERKKKKKKSPNTQRWSTSFIKVDSRRTRKVNSGDFEARKGGMYEANMLARTSEVPDEHRYRRVTRRDEVGS